MCFQQHALRFSCLLCSLSLFFYNTPSFEFLTLRIYVVSDLTPERLIMNFTCKVKHYFSEKIHKLHFGY